MSIVSEQKIERQTSSAAEYDVVVVGAGPYGLTTAAHLRGKGLRVAIFGKPLELWRDHMPSGMYLRSHWWATNLSDPQKKYSFSRFFKEQTTYKKIYPLPAEAFIEYALWFQKHVVPDVNETYVSSVNGEHGRFVLTLEDGRVITCSQVVMAVGLYYYARRPDEYQHFPSELVSHSFEHNDFSHFAGKSMLLIGGGQSAVEYTALLLEAGASVHLASRRPIHWLGPDRGSQRSLLEQLRAPNSGIAPGWRNWALEYIPYLFYRFPQERKDRYLRSHYNAAASDWLRDRVIGKAVLHEGQRVTHMEVRDGKVEAELTNGEKILVDHVMLATGYEVDLQKLPMLHPSLAMQVETDNGIPVLNEWFESSSVPGLYFVGLSSVRAFGPLYRFVVGNKATAQRVARAAARRSAHAKR